MGKQFRLALKTWLASISYVTNFVGCVVVALAVAFSQTQGNSWFAKFMRNVPINTSGKIPSFVHKAPSTCIPIYHKEGGIRDWRNTDLKKKLYCSTLPIPKNFYNTFSLLTKLMTVIKTSHCIGTRVLGYKNRHTNILVIWKIKNLVSFYIDMYGNAKIN